MKPTFLEKLEAEFNSKRFICKDNDVVLLAKKRNDEIFFFDNEIFIFDNELSSSAIILGFDNLKEFLNLEWKN